MLVFDLNCLRLAFFKLYSQFLFTTNLYLSGLFTGELLRVNDDLNNVFLRYERFERFRAGQTGSQTTDASNTPPVTQDSYLPPSYEQVSKMKPNKMQK